MAHVRKQIRAVVVAALSGNTDAGARVYPGRVYPLDTLPAIAVYTATEESETKNWEVLQRFVDITIVATDEAGQDESIDDLLDDIAEAIETAMAVDRKLGGLAKTSYLISTEDELTGTAEKPKGTITLTYKCEYRTAF